MAPARGPGHVLVLLMADLECLAIFSIGGCASSRRPGQRISFRSGPRPTPTLLDALGEVRHPLLACLGEPASDTVAGGPYESGRAREVVASGQQPAR